MHNARVSRESGQIRPPNPPVAALSLIAILTDTHRSFIIKNFPELVVHDPFQHDCVSRTHEPLRIPTRSAPLLGKIKTWDVHTCYVRTYFLYVEISAFTMRTVLCADLVSRKLHTVHMRGALTFENTYT